MVGSLGEGRDEGLIGFEVGGEAVEVEDAGMQVEWGIEAQGELWMIGRAGTSAISLCHVYSYRPTLAFSIPSLWSSLCVIWPKMDYVLVRLG